MVCDVGLRQRLGLHLDAQARVAVPYDYVIEQQIMNVHRRGAAKLDGAASAPNARSPHDDIGGALHARAALDAHAVVSDVEQGVGYSDVAERARENVEGNVLARNNRQVASCG